MNLFQKPDIRKENLRKIPPNGIVDFAHFPKVLNYVINPSIGTYVYNVILN